MEYFATTAVVIVGCVYLCNVKPSIRKRPRDDSAHYHAGSDIQVALRMAASGSCATSGVVPSSLSAPPPILYLLFRTFPSSTFDVVDARSTYPRTFDLTDVCDGFNPMCPTNYFLVGAV